MVGETLKNLLEPVGIEVRLEVSVVSAPPKVDLILIKRDGDVWTEKQRLFLADGLRDLEVDHILVELKVTENLNKKTLTWISMYDALYLETAKLERNQLLSVIMSSITPKREYLERYAFQPVGLSGVYDTKPLWGGVIRLILLNELADEAHNAPLKCFASHQEERKKAFKTIKQTELFRLSVSFGRIIVGLWRLLMKGSLNSPEMEGITPEYVVQLGKDWLDLLVDTTPDEELFALPKFEHHLVQRIKDGRQEEAATILLKQIRRKFGNLPEWVSTKVGIADVELIETWSDNFVFANSIEDVFA
ncbi:MAG: DUF4351 domain-containing protein [Magnetococcus sp. DMHC-6]